MSRSILFSIGALAATVIAAACSSGSSPVTSAAPSAPGSTLPALTTTVPPPPPTKVRAPEPPSTAAPPPAAGATRIDSFGIEQVFVPPGTFLMGTAHADGLEPPEWALQELASEQPEHEVEITQGFWIDKHEVTNEAFAAFVAAGGYSTREYWSEAGWAWVTRRREGAPVPCEPEKPDLPRACVTWYEAEAYAAWRGGRLPSEAEWEYAARGPDSLLYPWGLEWDPELANLVGADAAVPVGSFPDGASWVGALDMSGNVMEWVYDWWSPTYYAEGERVDPTGPDRGGRKVEKGGWFGSVAYVGRAAYRHFEDPPSYQDHHTGFRIVTE